MAHGHEMVLNNPLSLEEVREIILTKLRDTLRNDTRLMDYFACAAFRFHCDIAIVLQGAVHSDITLTIEGGVGQMGAPEQQHTVVSHTEQMEMPPNQARIEAGLGVPVLTRDEQGRQVEKKVKYGKGYQRQPKKDEKESA